MNAVQPRLISQDRTILHIDFDSFFASVEQQRNPLFRNRPVGVTAVNGRTCIIASSREAKKLGIETGERTYVAQRICPSIILTPSHFLEYWEISKKFLKICSDYSPFVELFSLDEVFIDITPTLHLFGSTQNIIDVIKERIRNEIGEYITVSVGVSHNKLLAKLASGMNKPNGQGEIGKSDIDIIYKSIKPTKLCGIGERMGARLIKIGITNLLQIRKYNKQKLILEFGPSYASLLRDMAWGKDNRPVVPYYLPDETKSVGRNYCLPQNEYDKRLVMQTLYELCEEVGLKLRRLDKKARTVWVSMHGNCNIGGRKTYTDYFDCGDEIFERIQPIIESHKCFEKEYVRQIHVGVSSLSDSKSIQPGLFDNPRKHSVQHIIDQINDKFGDHTIRNGFLLYSDKLTTMPNGYMADRYERAKLTI